MQKPINLYNNTIVSCSGYSGRFRFECPDLPPTINNFIMLVMWMLVVTLSSVKSLSTKYKWPIISLSWHKHLTFHNEILIHYRSHLSESIVFFTHRLLLDMFFTEHRICKCINQGFLILNRRDEKKKRDQKMKHI